MNGTHPRVREIEVRHQLGRLEAEQFLRGLAGSDPSAAKAVAELDQARQLARERRLANNQDHAAALGLDLEEARVLIARLAKDPELFTWLTSRVHVTVAHDRPLAHDE